jgi:hypothetical protein
VRFRYKLEDHDSEWQDPGTRHQAFYANLRPGKYRFRVIACNNDGIWNEEGASLAFSLAAAWYQTWWFRGASLAVFLALLWALYQWRIQQVRRQEKQLRDVIDTIPALAFSSSPDGVCHQREDKADMSAQSRPLFVLAPAPAVRWPPGLLPPLPIQSMLFNPPLFEVAFGFCNLLLLASCRQ